MKIKLMTGAAVACTMLCPGAWAAAPASPAPWAAKPAAAAAKPSASTEAQSEQWLVQLAGWTQGVNALMQEQAAVLTTIGGGVQTAQTYLEKHDSKGGGEWAGDWAKARRLQVQAYRQHAESVFNTGYPPPPAGVAQDPTVRMASTRLTAFAETARKHMLHVADMSEEIITLIEKAAAGDAFAARQIGQRAPEIAINLIRGECDMLDASRVLLKAGQPQSDLVTANIESNLAMIELLEMRRQEAGGEKVDLAGFRTRIHQHAGAARAAAEQMVLDARTFSRAVTADQTVQPEFAARLQKASVTYEASAQSEQAIADGLDKVADNLGKSDAASIGELNAALQSFDGEVHKRLELDQRRKRILTGAE